VSEVINVGLELVIRVSKALVLSGEVADVSSSEDELGLKFIAFCSEVVDLVGELGVGM
jgi:hypothetical protein